MIVLWSKINLQKKFRYFALWELIRVLMYVHSAIDVEFLIKVGKFLLTMLTIKSMCQDKISYYTVAV